MYITMFRKKKLARVRIRFLGGEELSFSATRKHHVDIFRELIHWFELGEKPSFALDTTDWLYVFNIENIVYIRIKISEE